MGKEIQNITGIRAMHIFIGRPGIIIGSPGIGIGLNIDASRRGHTNKGPNSKKNNLCKFVSPSYCFFVLFLSLDFF